MQQPRKLHHLIVRLLSYNVTYIYMNESNLYKM